MGVRAEQKEMRRLSILEKALDLFIHKGYTGTTVRDIASSLSISPALLFHYFDSKEKILSELLSIAQEGVVMAQLTFIKEKTPLENFLSVAELILNSFRTEKYSAPLFVLIHQIGIFGLMPEDHMEFFSHNPAFEASIPEIIRGQTDGSIRSGEPSVLALLFWSTIQGVAESCTLYGEETLPDPSWLIGMLKS